jgi:plastocyanin domain-containing protein
VKRVVFASSNHVIGFYPRSRRIGTEEVVLPDFGIRTFLPPHRTTPVSFTPAEGTYEFACGMGMVRGTIIAEKHG